MLRSLPLLGCRVAYKRVVRTAFVSDPFRESKGQFYYVIPEIPNEDFRSNPLLQFATLPKWIKFMFMIICRIDGLKAERIFAGISKQIIEYQVALSKLGESIKSGETPITYENIVTRVDEIVFPVQHSLRLVEGLDPTTNDAAWRMIVGRLGIKFLRAQSEHLYSNADIYGALHKVLTQLDPKDELKRGNSSLV